VTADRVVQSICPYCAVGCGQKVYVKDEQVLDPLRVRRRVRRGLAGPRRRRRPGGRPARTGPALLGLPLASYTAALLADTAVPAWHESRRTLPFVFAAGSAANAGGALTAPTPVVDATPARRLAVVGASASWPPRS
jgi:hypothetical protein